LFFFNKLIKIIYLPEFSISFNCILSDKLRFDDNDIEFVWLSICSSTLVLIGDKLLGLLSNIVFDKSTLFCNILANGNPSYVWPLCCDV